MVYTDVAISEIGNLIGIPNAAYFATLFKKRANQTPREFRKKFNKGRF
ncbi:helix-turn-helix domain-containing protein [Virgibacillus indicus]|nr:AraC family transcriptional regulator [Virgibacillus indicus]